LILKKNPRNVEVIYLKGRTLNELQNSEDALLLFEEVFTLADTDRLASNALLEIGLIRIKQRDYYEAYHSLS